MEVRKSNGTYESYSERKLVGIIKKVYKGAGLEVTDDEIQEILKNLYVYDGITCSNIRSQLENIFLHRDEKLLVEYKKGKNRKDAVKDFVEVKKEFISKYKKSSNTANATIDDNSNVSNKNIAVLNAELHKEENREINLQIIEDKLKELYPDFNYKQFRIDMDTIGYLHDSSSMVGAPYCVAISMYPFLLNGIKDLGGLSAKPKNIESFCGMFINMMFAIASQYKGAVAAPGLFVIMDWFLRKEFGENYHLKKDLVVSGELSLRKKTLQDQIHQYFQQIVYSLMQPCSARGAQSLFWNASVFDKPFFDTMYGDFLFPDGTPAVWESFNWLQKDFLHWFNQERLRCILTFPVMSVCLIYQNGEFLDKELYDFTCQEYSEGNSFFTYISDSADSLSSCCRLSSKLEKPKFSFTNGQLSEMTGSKNVITLNINRIVQDWTRECNGSNRVNFNDLSDASKESLKNYLINILDRIYKYQTAYNEILKELCNNKLLTAYSAGFIDLKKQYLTIGINGLNQASEWFGMQCNKNDQYKEFCNLIFSTIKEQNTLHKTPETMFNTEFTPCESAAIKLYNRDKADGYWVPEDTNLYASYIFKPNDKNISVLDKLYLHGSEFCGENLDGGQACHVNLEEHLGKEQYEKLLNYAAAVGCKYLTWNIPNCECDDCGYIAKQPFKKCPKCGSTHVSLWDRVIGYLTKIKNWSEGRQIEQKTRIYSGKDKIE